VGIAGTHQARFLAAARRFTDAAAIRFGSRALVVSRSEADDDAIAFPDLNGVSVVNPSCLENGCLIVWAVNEDGRPGNVTVFSNGIDAIFRHGGAPFLRREHYRAALSHRRLALRSLSAMKRRCAYREQIANPLIRTSPIERLVQARKAQFGQL
jgi:hypothetical protein